MASDGTAYRRDVDAHRLGYLARLPHTRTYMVMVIALCERWHNETTTFHLPNGEMMMTLEDVYHIFRLPVWGTPMMVTREMIAEAAIQGLMGPGVKFRI